VGFCVGQVVGFCVGQVGQVVGFCVGQIGHVVSCCIGCLENIQLGIQVVAKKRLTYVGQTTGSGVGHTTGLKNN